MARRFVAANSQYLESPTRAVTAFPVSMSCWFYPVSSGFMAPLTEGSGAGSGLSNFLGLQSLGSLVRACNNGQVIVVNIPPTLSAWNHICGTFSSAAITCYFGGTKAINSGSFQITNFLAVTTIGRSSIDAPQQYMDGMIGECGIWNAVLTDAEALMLSQGALPPTIRPQNLVGYWPLGTAGQVTELDCTPQSPRRIDMVVTGATPAFPPPPIAYFPPPRIVSIRPPIPYTLPASGGTFTETGVSATLNVAVVANSGTFSETGVAASLLYRPGSLIRQSDEWFVQPRPRTWPVPPRPRTRFVPNRPRSWLVPPRT